MRYGLTQVITLVKNYVIAVCDKEGKPDLGKSISTAVETAGKVGNRISKNKIQPTIEDWLLAWARQKDAGGELESILADDRWGVPPEKIASFMAELRPMLQRLADPTRVPQAKSFRSHLHRSVTVLSSDGHSPEVCQ